MFNEKKLAELAKPRNKEALRKTEERRQNYQQVKQQLATFSKHC